MKKYKFTKKHRENLSLSLRGYIKTDEHLKNIGLALIGKSLSEERKKHMRKKHILKPGFVSAMSGKHQTEYQKLRTSEVHSGKIVSKKTRKKLSKSMILAHEEGRLNTKKENHPNWGKKFSKKLYPKMGWRTSRKNQILPIKDTSIEIKIQKFLKLLSLEFFTHQYMKITHSYRCDILILVQKGITQKTIIECDGDYFHGNSDTQQLKDWQIERKRIDELRTKELIAKGFRVIRIWESEIKEMELNDLQIKLKEEDRREEFKKE